jgi:hypothetical protein
MRLISVIAGTAAVVAMLVLARFITGSNFGGFLAGLLLALDPISVRWSAYVRMYALLQACSIVLIWIYLSALLGLPSRRRLAAMVAVFWFGVFTHIAILLFWAPMTLCALVVHGRSLGNRRRDLAVALAACLGAPLVLVSLNELGAPPQQATSGEASDSNFVGEHILSVSQLLHPSLESWMLLFSGISVRWVIPAIVFGVSCLLVGRYFLSPPNGHEARRRQRLVGVVLLLHWLPICLVSAFVNNPQGRYLVHVHVFGFLLFVILVLDLYGGWRAPDWSVPSQPSRRSRYRPEPIFPQSLPGA